MGAEKHWHSLTLKVLRAYGCPVPVRTIASEINTRHSERYSPEKVSQALQELKKNKLVKRRGGRGRASSWEAK